MLDPIPVSTPTDEDRAEVSRFAKNFLPLLFNLFTSEATNEKSPTRLAVLETVKCYLQIADRELIGSFFDRCLGRTQEEDATAFTRYSYFYSYLFTYVNLLVQTLYI